MRIIRAANKTVSKRFTASGIPLTDCHLVTRDILKKGVEAWKKVVPDFTREKEEVDRVKQGQIVFDDRSKHQILNRAIFHQCEAIFAPPRIFSTVKFPNPWQVFRNFSHSSVNFVISQGTPRFETQEFDPPTKKKWKNTKKLRLHRKKEKQKRKAANRRDPRHLGIKSKKGKQKFANVKERIKYKLENAKIKEALLLERLKRYEVDKLQGPLKKPVDMTGEERFYMKKMAQKSSNYVPVGKRGIFGGVILNMHMHWKKHETVKVICKPCKPGQVQEYANEIARLSGGIPIQVIGKDTIIFYRGKDYVQPEIMSPIDTLSKKRALEKSKYEQSLETVRHFIAIAEKELELYYRHIALYGEPSSRDPNMVLDSPRKLTGKPKEVVNTDKTLSPFSAQFSPGLSGMACDSMDEVSAKENDVEDDELLISDLDNEDDWAARNIDDSCEEGAEGSSSSMHESKSTMFYC